MNSLVDLIKSMNKTSEKLQAILACFGELARILGESYPDRFTIIIPVIVGSDGLQNPDVDVVAASMITLNYFTRSLGPRMLPYMPKFIPTVMDILRTDIESGSKGELFTFLNSVDSIICITSFMTINVTIEMLPQFFSPYSSKVIEIVINQKLKGSKCMETISNTLNTMAEFILPRNLLPSIFNHASDISRVGESLGTLIFNFIGNILRKVTKADILEFRSDLIKFFLGAFDIRLYNFQGMSQEQILSLENCIISAFFHLILKLNDENFKPMYLKMIDWATLSISFDQLEKGDMIKRQITFYHIIDEMLNRLKVQILYFK